MKVFVAGATGVLGRRLIRQFRGRGDVVVGLARRPENKSVILAQGGEPRTGDLFDADSLARAAEGCDAVIHAATAIPAKPKADPKDWAVNDRIRREGTRALASAAAKVGARIYLQQSIAWVARPPDGLPFDEDSPVQDHPLYRSAVEGENLAREAGEKSGFQVAVLRCGFFYAADATHTRLMGQELMRRHFPVVGRGDSLWTLIHADDAAAAFVTAASTGQSGLWHIVDNQPVTLRDLLMEFVNQLGAPTPHEISVWLARLLAGKEAVNFLIASTRTSNARFRRDTCWSPKFPSFREGLTQVVGEWRKERFLVK